MPPASTDQLTPSEAVAEFCSGLMIDEVPTSVVEAAKLQLADTIGCIMAARCDQRSVERFARSLHLPDGPRDRSERSTEVASEAPTLWQAVAVDAYAARLLDYDNVIDETGDHPGVATAPIAVNVGDELNATGAEVLAAFIAGNEVQTRIRLATGQRLGRGADNHPWTTGTYAPMGAAATAARLSRASPHATLSALGHAFAFCSNTFQSQHEGSETHRVHHGIATAMGLQAHFFASAGIQGIRQWVEGPFGLYESLHRQSWGSELLDGLGQDFRMLDIVSKPYPIGRFMHPAIDAANEVAEALPDDATISSLELWVSQTVYDAVVSGKGMVPHTHVDAQFNLPFAVAVAIHGGTVELPGWLDPAKLMTERVARTLNSVTVNAYQHQGHAQQIAPVRIRVVTSDGQSFERTREPSTPSISSIKDKFIRNLALSGVPDAACQTAWEDLSALDTIGAGAMRQIKGRLRDAAGGEGIQHSSRGVSGILG